MKSMFQTQVIKSLLQQPNKVVYIDMEMGSGWKKDLKHFLDEKQKNEIDENEFKKFIKNERELNLFGETIVTLQTKK